MTDSIMREIVRHDIVRRHHYRAVTAFNEAYVFPFKKKKHKTNLASQATAGNACFLFTVTTVTDL